MYRYVIGPIKFDIERPQPISLKIEKMRAISIELNTIQIGGTYDTYDGAYTITPRVYEQTMATESKLMERDVSILSIPLTKVSNLKGGLTATIG